MRRSDLSSPASILVIEAESVTARHLQEALRAQCGPSLAIGVAGSFLEGMAHLYRHRTDAVLLDLALADCSATDTIGMLRQTAPRCALIAWSTVHDDAVFLDALRAGAHEVLALSSPAACDWRTIVEHALVRAGTGPAQPALGAHPSSLTRVIHDLNNVITSINGYADILLARMPSSDQARHCAEQIRHAGTRATGLVKSLSTPSEPVHSVPTASEGVPAPTN